MVVLPHDTPSGILTTAAEAQAPLRTAKPKTGNTEKWEQELSRVLEISEIRKVHSRAARITKTPQAMPIAVVYSRVSGRSRVAIAVAGVQF